MKQFVISLVILLTSITNANAMSYQQARDQALFLTDKMAYELNLNQQQYEAAYEINLDYLMDVNTVDDVYSAGWRQRNLDFQHVLLDWQYSAFCAATYFFRPLTWHSGNWHFAIYAHYPRRDFFYFSRPACYVSYRGAHSWRHNGGVSWYGRRVHTYRNAGRPHLGLRDNYHGHGVRREPGRPGMPHRDVHNNARPYGNQHHDTYRDHRPGTPVNNTRPSVGNNIQNRNDHFQNRNDRRNYTRESSTRTTVNSRDNGSRPTFRNTQPTTPANRGTNGNPSNGSPSFRNSGSRSFSPGNSSTSRGSSPSTRSASPSSQGHSQSRVVRR